MDATKKHLIYVAIDKCDIKAFRKILTETFDIVYPREDRIRRCLEEIQTTTFNSDHEHLITMRTSLIEAVSKVDQLTDDAAYKDQRPSALRIIVLHFQKLIHNIKDLNMKVQLTMAMAHHQPLTVQKLDDLLMIIDASLRENSDGSYPPQALMQQIPVHVARQDTKNKPQYDMCEQCYDRWNVRWFHTPDKCCLLSQEEKYVTMTARKDKKWLADHPGKTLPPRNAPSADKRKRTNNQEKESSPMKRERTM